MDPTNGKPGASGGIAEDSVKLFFLLFLESGDYKWGSCELDKIKAIVIKL